MLKCASTQNSQTARCETTRMGPKFLGPSGAFFHNPFASSPCSVNPEDHSLTLAAALAVCSCSCIQKYANLPPQGARNCRKLGAPLTRIQGSVSPMLAVALPSPFPEILQKSAMFRAALKGTNLRGFLREHKGKICSSLQESSSFSFPQKSAILCESLFFLKLVSKEKGQTA